MKFLETPNCHMNQEYKACRRLYDKLVTDYKILQKKGDVEALYLVPEIEYLEAVLRRVSLNP